MRHRRDTDGPTPHDWDAAAARAPPARKPPRGRRRRAASLKDYLPQEPLRLYNYIFVAIPFVCFIGSLILPKRPLYDLGAGFMTDEHFARRYLTNATNTTTTPPPATEAVFFEYTIVSRFRHYHFRQYCLSCSASSSCYGQAVPISEYRFARTSSRAGRRAKWNYDFVIVTSIKDEGISSSMTSKKK